MINNKNNLVELGFCRSAHGIKGGFTFTLFNMEESVLEVGKELTLKGIEGSSLQDDKQLRIEKISFGNKVIVYLEGVSDRNSVDEMIPFKIFIDRSEFPEDDDTVYLVDLIGLSVYEHGTDRKVGVIKNTYDNGAQDVMVILRESGRKLEIPFVDHFFPVVDLEQGRIEVIVPVEI